MKLKAFGAVFTLSLGALAAQASTTPLGLLGTIIRSGGGLAASFNSVINDNFTFSLAAESVVQSTVTSFAGSISPSYYGIYTSGADGLIGTADDVQIAGYAFSAGNLKTLAAGDYYFNVFGVSKAALSAYSIAASATAVPVPEPQAYVMLGVGLAATGLLAMRRRRG